MRFTKTGGIIIFITFIILVVCIVSENTRYTVRHTLLNVGYMLAHLELVKEGKARLHTMELIIDNEDFDLWDLDYLMEYRLSYEADSLGSLYDRRDWMLVFAMRDWQGDCDEFAAFAQWVAKKKGWKAEFYLIVMTNGLAGHCATLIQANNKTYLADTQGVRLFKGWKNHFANVKIAIKRWRKDL